MGIQVLTIRDVAQLLKINEKTVYKLAAGGRIPAFKVGGSWRFRQSDLDQWIDDQQTAKKAAADKEHHSLKVSGGLHTRKRTASKGR